MGARPPRFAADDQGLPTRPDGVQLRARRSPRLIAIGVLCACLGGLGAAFLYSNAAHSQTVVLMAQAVQRGDIIERSDLTTVTIGSVPGVATVAVEGLDALVGQSALVDLPRGSLPAPASVGTPIVPPGTVQVGLKLTVGRVPTGTVPAGSKVLLIEVEENKTTPGRTFPATLIGSPYPLGDAQTYAVDVRVSSEAASQVAVLAARDRIVLVREADR